MKYEIQPINKKGNWLAGNNIPEDAEIQGSITFGVGLKNNQYRIALDEKDIPILAKHYNRSEDDFALIRTPNKYSVWQDSTLPYTKIKLSGKTAILDDEIIEQRIQLAILRAHPEVANSEEELQINPDAYKYIIRSEMAEIQIKNNKIARKDEVRKKLEKLKLDQLKAIYIVVTERSLSNKSSEYMNVVKEELLDSYLDKTEIELGKDPDLIHILHVIYRAIETNIIIRDKGALYWNGEIIAAGIDELAKFLKDPQNQSIKADILTKLQNR